MNLTALLLSLRLAALVSLILLLISLPLGSWIAFGKWRGRFLVEAVVSLPLVLPPTVLGFYLLIALGSRSPLGRLWERLFGHGLAFTFEGLVIASLLYSLPFAVQPVVAAFRGVDPKLIQASAVLGASPLRTRLANSASCSWSAAICPVSRARSPSRSTIRCSRLTTQAQIPWPWCSWGSRFW